MPEPVAVSNGSVRTWSTVRIRVPTTIGAHPRAGKTRISRSTETRAGAATVWRRPGLAGMWTSRVSDSSCARPRPARSACSRSTRSRCRGSATASTRHRSGPTSSTSSRSPASPPSHSPEPVQPSSMSTPLGPPSSGHAGTRRGTASRTDRSAGWSMTHERSSPARSVAVAAITASCSTHRHTGTGRLARRGGCRVTSSRCWTTSVACWCRARSSC